MPFVEDIELGRTYPLGQYRVSRDEIVEFARRWDPQEFHLESSGDGSPFNGLIASGWHTASVFMQLYVAEFLNDGTGAGSPGVDELRWPVPVYAGNTLTATVTPERVMPSIGHRDRAIATLRCTVVNEQGKTALSMKLHNIFLRRPAKSDQLLDSTVRNARV
jgi:acyl dehydratase